jgi:hypothetical protein
MQKISNVIKYKNQCGVIKKKLIFEIVFLLLCNFFSTI